MNRKRNKQVKIRFSNKLDYAINLNNKYKKNLAPSDSPPGGLKPSEVPMFVNIGFDDNMISGYEGSGCEGGVDWVLNTFDKVKNPDGSSCFTTFFCSSQYITDIPEDKAGINKIAWFDARLKGHEIANHTHSHNSKVDPMVLTSRNWYDEVYKCKEKFELPFNSKEIPSGYDYTGIGLHSSELTGFRAPYLKVNKKLFPVLKEIGISYDSSLIEGHKIEQIGSDFLWPYTLESLELKSDDDEYYKQVEGLWEFPIYALIIPNDNLSEMYNFNKGLIERVCKAYEHLMPPYKVQGIDFDLLIKCKLNKNEYLAILKYNFDLRFESNRCPFIFIAHSEQYATNAPWINAENITVKEKQEVIEEFLQYVLTKEDTRIVSLKQLENWMKCPASLNYFDQDKNSINVEIVKKESLNIKIHDINNRVILTQNIDSDKDIICIKDVLDVGVYYISITGGANYLGKIYIRK